MPFLILLGLWLVAELALLIFCIFKLGFFVTLALMLLSSAVGGLILHQNRADMMTMVHTPTPRDNARHGVYQFTSGMLFAIPGFLSSLIALIFWIPPLRRLAGAGLLKLFRPQVVADTFFNFDGTPPPQPERPRKPFEEPEPQQDITATREDGTVIHGELIDHEKKQR